MADSQRADVESRFLAVDTLSGERRRTNGVSINDCPKMRTSRGYWIWGQFDEPSTKELTGLKSKVDEFLQGPLFDVHLTLSGPIKKIDKRIESLFHGLNDQTHQIEVQVVKYGYKDKYYESLFIEISKSEELLELKKLLDDVFKLESKPFFPHISLFYGEESESKKNVVLSELPKVLKKISLNKVSLVRVDEEIELWEVIHQIQMG